MRHLEMLIFLGKQFPRDFQYDQVQAKCITALVLEQMELSVHFSEYRRNVMSEKRSKRMKAL